jgi:hypothetical protein
MHASPGIPTKFMHEGPLRLRISKDNVVNGMARLTDDRLVFFQNSEVIQDISISWKVIEPFVDELRDD